MIIEMLNPHEAKYYLCTFCPIVYIMLLMETTLLVCNRIGRKIVTTFFTSGNLAITIVLNIYDVNIEVKARIYKAFLWNM
jgi:hypothetical protein